MPSTIATAALRDTVNVLGSSAEEVHNPTRFAVSQMTATITKYTIISQTSNAFNLTTFGEPWNPAVKVAYYLLVVVLPILVASNVIWFLYLGCFEYKRWRTEQAKKNKVQSNPQTGELDNIELDTFPPSKRSSEGPSRTPRNDSNGETWPISFT
jgi:hypothetical protein